MVPWRHMSTASIHGLNIRIAIGPGMTVKLVRYGHGKDRKIAAAITGVVIEVELIRGPAHKTADVLRDGPRPLNESNIGHVVAVIAESVIRVARLGAGDETAAAGMGPAGDIIRVGASRISGGCRRGVEAIVT